MLYIYTDISITLTQQDVHRLGDSNQIIIFRTTPFTYTLPMHPEVPSARLVILSRTYPDHWIPHKDATPKASPCLSGLLLITLGCRIYTKPMRTVAFAGTYRGKNTSMGEDIYGWYP